MFRKILLVFTFICSLSVLGCQDQPSTTSIESTTEVRTEEYIITEEVLNATMIHDNYRVYYQILVGTFSDSNQDGMGDIQGIINRLDYLNDGDINSGKSLGVTGIWLMPIMPSPSYHKYDATDYQAIDPAYGTIDDFSQLIEAANQRDIDIIIDLVINHSSDLHPWFQQALSAAKAGDFDSPYLEYYTLVTETEKVPGRTYYHFHGDLFYEGNFSSRMPELNLDSQLVRNEISNILEFWFDLGVKGFRLDAVKYPYFEEHEKNIDFWNWFMDEVRKYREDAYVVGEMWDSDEAIINYYEPFNNFDFGLSQLDGYISLTVKNIESVNDFVRYIDQYMTRVKAVNPNAILQPFISNHDMNRAAGYLSVEDHIMHMAANLYLLTYGTPFIYYGEEIGMLGSRGSENTDANRRLVMHWGDGDTVENPVGSTWTIDRQRNGTVAEQIIDSHSLYNHYKKLLMIRHANPEIARGTYTPLYFDGRTTFGGYLSTYQSSTIGVFHNTSMQTIIIDLSLYTDQDFNEIRGYVGLDLAQLNGQVLTLGPLTSVVLK